MRRRAVVTLLVILDRQLPVGRNVVGPVRGDPEVREIEQGHRLLEIAHGAVERRGIVAETDEHQAVDFAVGHGPQRIPGPVEIVGHASGCDQPAVRVVGPAVVRAGELARITAFFEAHQRTPVAADVCKGPDRSVLAANDDRRLARHLQDLEVPGRCKLGHVSRKDPVAGDDPVELELVDGGVGVEALVEGVSGLVCRDQ